jgi:tRNA(Ile)-lysidine synthase
MQRQLTALGVVLDFELVEQLRAAPEKFVSVSSGLSVARDTTGKITLQEQVEEKFKPDEFKLQLQGRAEQAAFAGRKFRWQIQPQRNFVLPQKQAGLEIFDADKIGGEIILRHWRAGDRFQPIGLKSPVKLQDLFVNSKIPAARRRGLILAATAVGEIFWVEGLRISERFKLTPDTKLRLTWRWRGGLP